MAVSLAVLSNILKQEYNHYVHDDIPSIMMQAIRQNIGGIEGKASSYQSMMEAIKAVIRKQVSLPQCEIEFILDLIDYKSNTTNDEPKNENLSRISDIRDIPITLRDLEYISSSLKLLSFAQPIIITKLFCSLQQNKSDLNDMTVLTKVFDQSIASIMEQLENTTQVALDKSKNIDYQTWQYSNIEISLLWDIYCVYSINETYLRNRNLNYSTMQFRDYCIDTHQNSSILAEENTVFWNAINFFQQNVVSIFRVKQRNECIIEDDFRIYIRFMFSFNKYLNSLSLKSNKCCCPLQFDLVFIPKQIKNLITGCNIAYDASIKTSLFENLQFVQDAFGDDSNLQSIDAICYKLKEMMNTLHSKYKDWAMQGCQYTLILNRRDVQNPIYLYRHKSRIIDSNDSFMHFRTKRNILFKESTARNALVILSYHLHSFDTHRLYLHYDQQCVRFFPSMIRFWSKYFVSSQETKKFVSTLDIKNGFTFKLYDLEFDQLFKSITGSWHWNVNYHRNTHDLMENDYDTRHYMKANVWNLSQEQFLNIFMNVLNYPTVNDRGKDVVDIRRCSMVIHEMKLDGYKFMKMNKMLLRKRLTNEANLRGKDAQKVIDKMQKLDEVKCIFVQLFSFSIY